MLPNTLISKIQSYKQSRENYYQKYSQYKKEKEKENEESIVKYQSNTFYNFSELYDI